MGSRDKLRPTPPPQGPALVRPAIGVLLLALGGAADVGCTKKGQGAPPMPPPMPDPRYDDPPPMPPPREEAPMPQPPEDAPMPPPEEPTRLPDGSHSGHPPMTPPQEPPDAAPMPAPKSG